MTVKLLITLWQLANCCSCFPEQHTFTNKYTITDNSRQPLEWSQNSNQRLNCNIVSNEKWSNLNSHCIDFWSKVITATAFNQVYWWKIHWLASFVFTHLHLHSITSREQHEKHLYGQSNHYKKYGIQKVCLSKCACRKRISKSVSHQKSLFFFKFQSNLVGGI